MFKALALNVVRLLIAPKERNVPIIIVSAVARRQKKLTENIAIRVKNVNQATAKIIVVVLKEKPVV
jgi:hypothetical protein